MAGKTSILLIDDEPIVLKRLKQALEKSGHEVEIFDESPAAMKRLEERDFDIVVTDIRMPNMDGMHVLNHVRAKSSRIKVIMITGYATIEVAREALAKGAFDFIAKPFNPNDLREVITRAVGNLEHGE